MRIYAVIRISYGGEFRYSLDRPKRDREYYHIYEREISGITDEELLELYERHKYNEQELLESIWNKVVGFTKEQVSREMEVRYKSLFKRIKMGLCS